jgi:hypothetical protein
MSEEVIVQNVPKVRKRKTRSEEKELTGSSHVDVVYEDSWIEILDSYKKRLNKTSRGEVVRVMTSKYHSIASYIDPNEKLIFLVVREDNSIVFRMPASFFLQ